MSSSVSLPIVASVHSAAANFKRRYDKLPTPMNDDEKAIRKLIDNWLEGTRTGDVESVLQLMAEDVVFLQPGQPPMRGREAYAAAQAGTAQFDFTGDAQIQEIRVLGDWAYCWN
jgi:uncharacterized protein (TIGR02246 family)